jgi:5-methyltetrahydrofolate corrinoid/iron sulfur protein methyltransferase
MYVIGERINGMFQDVKKAIRAHDPEPIKQLALGQVKAGASALDVNVGPATSDALNAMLWLVDCIQQVSDAPLVIDNPKFSIMAEVLPKVKNPVIINSTKADEDALEKYCKLAVDNDASLVALTIDQSGVPNDADGRVMLSATILTKAMEAGLTPDRLFIDPIILPVNVAPKQPQNVLEALQQLTLLSDPPPHLVLGLSNVSQNCNRRELINRTYLAMAVGAGLDAAIMDPFDTELMETAVTAELLQEKMIYCDSFIEAVLSG